MDSLPSKGHLFVPRKGKSAVLLFEDEVMFETDFANKSPERPLHSQGPHEAVYDEAGPPQQASHQEGGEEESVQLAREVGMRQTEFKQQRKAMQEIEKKRQLDEVKWAIPDQSINESSQAETWRQASEEQSREEKHGREGGQVTGDQSQPQKRDHVYGTADATIPSWKDSPIHLEVGSAVQYANNDSRTGVIRWIGNLPGMQGTIAGVELVSGYQ